ncbi:MAG: hypothetical protein EXR71_09420 [Myxococcales bacterium]|nr:hypothetical protein [Myxococcales bacterium]
MSLADDLDQQLRPGVITVAHPEGRADASVVDADRLGVSLKTLRVTVAGRSLDAAMATLPEAVGRCLGIPWIVAEHAPTLGGAVLRSPVDPADREFYELRTSGADAELQRWRVQPAGREQVPFTLTRKDLGRLVSGLTGR